jgi:hypothetical protein
MGLLPPLVKTITVAPYDVQPARGSTRTRRHNHRYGELVDVDD